MLCICFQKKYPHEKYYRARGLCYRKDNKLDMAISDLKLAVSLPEKYSDNMTRIILIETLFEAKNIDDAVQGTVGHSNSFLKIF